MNRLIGFLLFLPVPIVLVLLTQSPIGTWPSLLLAIALIATHPLYARRFALAHARCRSFWSGADLSAHTDPQVGQDGEARALFDGTLKLHEPLGETRWGVASLAEARRVVGTLEWGYRKRLWLRCCILGGLLLLIAGSVAEGLGQLAPVGLRLDDFRHAFRLLVAVAVLPLSLIGVGHTPSHTDGTRTPFPVHIAALIGLRWVLVLFRVIGALWLTWALVYGYQRLFS